MRRRYEKRKFFRRYFWEITVEDDRILEREGMVDKKARFKKRVYLTARLALSAAVAMEKDRRGGGWELVEMDDGPALAGSGSEPALADLPDHVELPPTASDEPASIGSFPEAVQPDLAALSPAAPGKSTSVGRFPEVAAPLLGVERPPRDLLRCLQDDPHDLGAWQVIGDWWKERDDPRGQAIAVDIAIEKGKGTPELQRARQDLIDENQQAWIGPDLVRALGRGDIHPTWRMGQLMNLTVDPCSVKLLRRVLEDRDARFPFLRDLTLVRKGRSWGRPLDDLGSRESGLAHLHLIGASQDGSMDRVEVDRAAAGLGDLTELVIEGDGLLPGRLDFPELTRLVVGDSVFASALLEGGAVIEAPLITLVFDFDPEGSGGEDITALLPELFEGEIFPELRHLELAELHSIGPLLSALIESPLLRRLQRLGIRSCGLTEESAALMTERFEAFRHLQSLDLTGNSFGEKGDRLDAALFGVVQTR